MDEDTMELVKAFLAIGNPEANKVALMHMRALGSLLNMNNNISTILRKWL